MSKAFDEYWATVQGDAFGKRCVVSAVRTCWNAAIEAAAKELEEKSAYLEVPEIGSAAKFVRALRTEGR